MRLAWVSLLGFRSYEELVWHPDPGVNLLVGPNGAGKTNLLEAVGYLATLRSFRGAPEEALVAFEREAAVARAEVEGEGSSTLVEVELRRRGGRRAQVNRQRLRRTSDLLGVMRIVAFLPEDLDIVKRGPAHRRDFLDQLAVQLWPGSHADQAELERAIRQRNTFLRQGEDDPVTLGVWDERVAVAGGKVMARRARAASLLASHLVEAHAQVAGTSQHIEVDYRSEWGGTLDPSTPAGRHAELLGEALTSSRRVDRERRVTTMGPHRDEPVLLLDGHDLRHHGSQGEQRTVALSLRMGSHRAIEHLVGVPPILLLDDVYSELDPARSAALTRALPAAQTLVTTANPGEVPLQGRSWKVGGGAVVG